MIFGITPEGTIVSNGAPATRACIPMTSPSTQRWVLLLSTGRRMDRATITKRPARQRSTKALPLQAPLPMLTSMAIRVRKALGMISELTNPRTNPETWPQKNTPYGQDILLSVWGYSFAQETSGVARRGLLHITPDSTLP